MKLRKLWALCPLLVVVLLPAATLCQTYPEDMIAYWKFDEGSGTVARDSSGEGHDGTLVNGPTWTSGIKGGALSFDGIDDYVAIPDSVDFDFGDGDFTILAWFKTTVGLSEQYLIDFFCDGNFPHIEIYTALHSLGSHLCGVGNVCTRLSDGTVDTGDWHHVAITLDNSTPNGYVMYVDGVKTTWGTFSESLDGWDTISIAARVFTSGYVNEPWKGEIDDVLIYNRVLTAEEIADIFALFTDGFESGDTSVWSDAVSCPGCPVAKFLWSGLGGDIQFLNQSTGSPPLTFWWDFGDGTGSAEIHPLHAYVSPGVYSVTLTAANPFGHDSVTKTVVVQE